MRQLSIGRLMLTLAALLLGANLVAVSAQQDATTTAAASAGTTVSVPNGSKAKVKGTVVRRDADTFTVRDFSGNDTVVLLTDRTSVKSKGGFLSGGKNFGVTSILRGLNLEVEGRGDSNGQLVADKIRFSESEYRVARSIDTRVNPVEGRVGEAEGRIQQVEQNSQRLSGQIDELVAVSNAARGGARAAQDTADAAVAGVNATNERISALDDYEPAVVTTVNFRTGSSVLSTDAKSQLDELASRAKTMRGFMIEVTGFADATGSTARNRALSQRRADTVIRYLLENHQVPLRRIVQPYGYGESNAIAENNTRDGRAQNRRVEVKILVSKGIAQPVNVTTPAPQTENPE